MTPTALIVLALLRLMAEHFPTGRPPVPPPRPALLGVLLLGSEPFPEFEPHFAAGNVVWSTRPPHPAAVERMGRAADFTRDLFGTPQGRGAVIWMADDYRHYVDLLNAVRAEGQPEYKRRFPAAQHINSKSLIILTAVPLDDPDPHPSEFAEELMLRSLGHEVAHNQFRHAVGIPAVHAANVEGNHLFNEAMAEAVEVQTIACPTLRDEARRLLARRLRAALEAAEDRAALEKALHDEVHRNVYQASAGLFLAGLEREPEAMRAKLRAMPGSDPETVARLAEEAMRVADRETALAWCEATLNDGGP